MPPRMIQVLLATITLTGCVSTADVAVRTLPPRPAMDPGIPDLTRGEGPALEEAARQDWFLHCGRTRGWAHRDEFGKSDSARQILITQVPIDSPTRHDLQEGDVILGVEGRYFSRMPIREFREASVPAQRAETSLDVILWRRGWERERIVTVNLAFLPIDFIRGEPPGLAVDWNLGPTGARGWIQDRDRESLHARQILVTKVEQGSPADGILQAGDVILGVDGQDFDRDARRAFAEAIGQAETEAGRGRLRVRRWRGGTTDDVTIPIEVMGSYSATTPWNCAKTERILERAVAYLIANDVLEKGNGPQRAVAALALMSTGTPEHMEMARDYVYRIARGAEDNPAFPPNWGYAAWGWGYHNLLLSEYYLLTADETVLPAIRIFSNRLAEGQSGVGSWGHRMAAPNHGRCPGYGAMNQSGTICWLSLLMARRCGVSNATIEQAIVRGRDYLAKFVDRQTVPYGDNIQFDPDRHDDNGKNSAAAVAFSVLGEAQGADYFTRMTLASWNDREYGHTGVWWSLLWGPLGATRAGEEACSAFLRELTWLHDLERRWDGGFIYQGKMGWGYGVDEATGRQRQGSEHVYGHWDTTAGRILMYTLPQRRLVISGKDSLVKSVVGGDLAATLDAGRLPEQGQRFARQRYDGRPREELIELLGSRSPVVRHRAALSLARLDGDHTETLVALLNSPDRHVRYGACTALRMQGGRSAGAVEPLLALLHTEDQAQSAHALMALGALNSDKATAALLALAGGDMQDDPYDYLHRITALALFGRGGPLAESIDGVDRPLLIPAVRRLLGSTGGVARSLTARATLPRMSFDELSELWPAMIPALREHALTEVVAGDEVRMIVARLLAENRVEEGMPLLLELMRTQRGHGAGNRHAQIMDWLVQYGTSAHAVLPALEEYLAFLEQDHPWVDRSRPGTEGFFRAQIPHVKQAVEAIQAAQAGGPMTSIAPYLEQP